MGHFCSKLSTVVTADDRSNQPPRPAPAGSPPAPVASEVNSLAGSPFPPSPSPGRTPMRKFRWPLPPPSPARPIMSAIVRRRGPGRPKEGPIAEAPNEDSEKPQLDKTFGYPKNFGAKFELEAEIGRGHFGHTCRAKGKKGELKGQTVAVKIISKAKMTTTIAIEDVRREVKILRFLSGNSHIIRFHGAYEDNTSVFVVTELCEGGELLDRILARGGRYREEEAKTIVVQILSAVAYFHLQGVVHRDLKPENFLFTTKEEDAPMKIIDFGLSDFIGPDMWSVGVITYILLCRSRPFWARTESGIFQSVLRANPNFDDSPWPVVSAESKDFVKRLLNKDHRKRMTAAQALTHPWLRDEGRPVPLDILIYKLVKSYIHASSFKRAALKALSKALTEDELIYLRVQFNLLEPTDGCVSLDNFRSALLRNHSDAMKESRVPEILQVMEPLAYKRMDFEEFCSAAISVHQLEAREDWDKIANRAFEHFEHEGNRVISVDQLAQEMNPDRGAGSLHHCVRPSDGKLSFLGYTKFLCGITMRNSSLRPASIVCECASAGGG